MNLYQKLHAIQQEVNGLGKDAKGYGYNYVSGSKVLDYVKPLMNKHGLLLKQEITSIENVRQDYNAKSGPKSEVLSKVMMRFTWIDIETGEKDVNEFGANGQNEFEKGLGSALTYAERYFLLKYFHIATDKDDVDNVDRKESTESAAPKAQAKQAPKAPARSDKPTITNGQLKKEIDAFQTVDEFSEFKDGHQLTKPQLDFLLKRFKELFPKYTKQ